MNDIFNLKCANSRVAEPRENMFEPGTNFRRQEKRMKL